MERRVKQILYNQRYEISAACAMLVFNASGVSTQTWVSIGENALSEFLDNVMKWEKECIEHLKKNVPIGRLSARKQEEFDDATHCHICRKPFKGD